MNNDYFKGQKNLVDFKIYVELEYQTKNSIKYKKGKYC